ncbi:MAG: helix-turn-helix domain-containing protein [Propionicimonas sp.]
MTAVRDRVPRAGLGPTRADVLAHLREAASAQPVTAIAAAVDLHPNTARFHLDALVDQHLVAREYEKRDRPGRPKLLYRAEPRQPSEAAALQDLAGALVRHLDRLGDESDDQAEAAGRFWGEELAAERPDQSPLDRVVSTLAELGYQPTVVGEPAEAVVLTPCPLRALDIGEVPPDRLPSICRLHLGLMRGLLADDPEFGVGELHPLATPTSCVARLTRLGDA